MEQDLDRLIGRRLARAHHAIDGHPRRLDARCFIAAQGLGNKGPTIEIIGKECAQAVDARLAQLGQQGFGDFIVGVGDDLAGRFVDHRLGQHPAKKEVVVDQQTRQSRRLDVPNVLGGDALILGDDDFAITGNKIKAGHLATQTLGEQGKLDLFLIKIEGIKLEEFAQDFVRRHADRLQQRRHRHLAASVHTEKERILGIKFEVEPGATVGNHARRKEKLARTVGLAPVVLEKHTGRTVQLRNNDALRPVNHKRTIGGHERNLAHIHFLLLDLLDRIGSLPIHNHQADAGTQGRSIGQAALLAFLDVKGGLAQSVADELQARIA
ncbi:MAG: hypothetical protein BWY57_02858 [Betaproteobacteria bacterium ADurb.Bin341]|nr:MAG: hypothetical protein BWY57_02858 [Betaproteobacteria bacterium ADurb.Bin341]